MKKELIFSKSKELLKGHFYVVLLLLITLVYFHGILSSSVILDNIHYVNDLAFESENYRKFLHENGAFPLWTPYFYAGQPFIAVPEYYIFDLNFLFIYLFESIFLSMNLSVISYFFIGSLGMYLLVYEFVRNREAAFISSLIFMFNEYVQGFVLGGHINLLESYSLIPFVLLFVHKALKEKNWFFWSVIAGLFFTMIVHVGGIIFLLYTALLAGAYMVWNLIGPRFANRLVKAVLVGIVFSVILLGLSAIKLLPTFEFVEISSRGAGVNLQEYLGHPISFSNFWSVFISIGEKGFSAGVGILGFLLAALGLISYRKKVVIFSLIVALFGAFFATGGSLAQLFYHLPGFGQMRHVERALLLFVFVIPLLAGFGYVNLLKIIKGKFSKLNKHLFVGAVFIILAFELVALQGSQGTIGVVKPKEVPIVNEVSKDKGAFRVVSHSLTTPIGASGYHFYTQLGISSVKGGGGIWMNDYARFLSVAQQSNPSKLFGIMNGKYVVSDNEMGDDGLSLVGVFESDCKNCRVGAATGPYLYLNNNSIPRAFTVNNSILLVGSEGSKTQFIYSIMLGNFNPLNTVLVDGRDSLSAHSLEELHRFDAVIFLGGSVDQGDAAKLQQYIRSGGKIVPNVLQGENSISQQALDSIFPVEDSFSEAELEELSVNKYSASVGGGEWLVLSERFAHFPGWKASINDEDLKIYKADEVITAVYLGSKKGELIFKYRPESFTRGAVISLLTLIAILAYFAFIIYKKGKRK